MNFRTQFTCEVTENKDTLIWYAVLYSNNRKGLLYCVGEKSCCHLLIDSLNISKSKTSCSTFACTKPKNDCKNLVQPSNCNRHCCLCTDNSRLGDLDPSIGKSCNTFC